MTKPTQMSSSNPLIQELEHTADKRLAKNLTRFFKTQPGEYGAGDVFRGISMPSLRKIEKKYRSILDLKSLQKLIQSKFHEDRMIVAISLRERYEKSDVEQRKKIVEFYIKNMSRFNNWDLIDISAHKIIGEHVLQLGDWSYLKKLARSTDLWKKRISIISTFAHLRNNDLEPCIHISKMLLSDRHDLIHKAVGWVLREVGKKDMALLEDFLQKNYHQLSRTTLRYAIEKFSPHQRQTYLKGEFN